MAKVLSFFKTIRNNWKKSVIGTAALSYGVSYSKEAYDTQELMRNYCQNVIKYGDVPCPTSSSPRHVTVILNPSANKGKAKKLFEKYCEPLLHLAGIAVTIIETNSGSHARSIITNLDTPTDAIIVAGGDGTLFDVVTALMRKCQCNVNSMKQYPIGILPLGQTNKVANAIYEKYDELPKIHEMVDATMAIIQENTKMVDVVQVESLDENEENSMQPVYGMGAIEWGAWTDAHTRVNKYWYWGSLRKYITYVFNGYKQNLNWDCNATLRYTEPCDGCSQCYNKLPLNPSANSSKRWWHAFIPKTKTFAAGNEVDYSKVINEKCNVFHEVPISTTELEIKTSNISNVQSKSMLKIHLAPKHIDYSSFVTEGWKREKYNDIVAKQILEAKEIELYPEKTDKEQMCSIDNEEYGLRPIRIKLLPHSVRIFCPEDRR